MSDDDSDEEIYSITSSKTIYRRSRSKSRPSIAPKDSLPKIVVHEEKNYYPVTKWAVDYNNKNYVRSKLNKNKGLHRKIVGRPLDWRVEYDNNYFARSKVNAPKGLHRRIPDVRRKYVPEDDELSDAEGWEFDYGPEFDQPEQDVKFIPEGRIVTRGCYRWHGAIRNDSDYDFSEKEERENLLNEELEAELKYGREFLQADVPHMAEQLDRRYSRGGFRYYEVQRNINDIKAEEFASSQHDPEWRRKHHHNGFRYQELDMGKFDHDEESDHRIAKGKPFRRTILNKIYALRKKVDSREQVRYGTRISLVPGEGEKTLYEGRPDRFPFKPRKTPSMRSVFRRPERRRLSARDKEYLFENRRDYDLKPKYANRMKEMATERRRPSRRSSSLEDVTADKRSREMVEEYAYRMHEVPRIQRSKTEEESSSLSDGPLKEDFEIWKENAEKKSKQHKEHRNGEKNSQSKSKNQTEKKSMYDDKEYVEQRKGKEHKKDKDFKEKKSNGEKKTVQQKEHRNEDKILQSKSKNQTEKKSMYDDKEYVEQRKSKEYRKDKDVNEKKLNGEKKRVQQKEHRNEEKISQSKSKNQTEKKPKYDDKYVEERNSKEYKKDKDFNEMKMVTEKKISRKKINTNQAEYRPRKSKDNSARSLIDADNEMQIMTQDEDEALKKMPPHVEERVNQIRHRMEQKMDKVNNLHAVGNNLDRISKSESEIDLMKHKSHPKDHGQTHNEKYEKYETKNGSEVWVKKEEKFAELHHRNSG